MTVDGTYQVTCKHIIDNTYDISPVKKISNSKSDLQGRSFKVTGNGVIRLATYDFLLAFYSNYVCILHCFCSQNLNMSRDSGVVSFCCFNDVQLWLLVHISI